MTLSNSTNLEIKLSSINKEKRIVYGVVYAPNMLDAVNGFTDEEQIAEMAHKFLLLNIKEAIDTEHNNISNKSYPVESFIAKESDSEFPTGAWVIGTKIVSDDLWNDIIQGKYNGYSMQSTAKAIECLITYETFPTIVGETEVSNGHSHYFYIDYNSAGKVVRGYTSEDDGHSHLILTNSITESVGGHSHRVLIYNK